MVIIISIRETRSWGVAAPLFPLKKKKNCNEKNWTISSVIYLVRDASSCKCNFDFDIDIDFDPLAHYADSHPIYIK